VRELGYGAVAFMDDNFTFSPDRVHEICDGILKRAFDLHWWCFSRVDTIVRHPEMIRHMAKAGLHSIFIGIESPSTKVLDHFKKGIEPEKAVEAVKILKRNGIHTWAGFILGAPEEHRQDLRATIRFAKELDTETAEFTLLTPYPGTVIYEELKNQIIVEDWEKYDAVHSVYKHPCIPKLELQAWLAWANISFYLRHGRSIRNFFRFLSNRKFGGQIISKVVSSRRT
jgi:anaerobic magnesium-protoporphyrin IX monomethyl ester cyclase